MKWKLSVAILAVLTLLGAAVIVLAVSTIEVPKTAHTQAVTTPEPPTVEELLRLVNEERAKVGVAPLVLDPLLNKSAQIKADDMLKNSYFGHVDAQGKHGYEYVADVGKNCIVPSENIVGEKSSIGAVEWWMNSQSHREAIHNSNYESVGFGIRFVERIPLSSIQSTKPVNSDLVDSYVIVQHFCDER